MKPDEFIAGKIDDAIRDFAKFKGCTEVVITQSNEKKVLKEFLQARSTLIISQMSYELPEEMSLFLTVYISYFNEDKAWKEQIERFISSNAPGVRILSDDELLPGSDKRENLFEMRDEPDVFLLLISKSYLSSKSIRQNEWPQMQKRAGNVGVYIVCVILEPCEWEHEWFAKYKILSRVDRQTGDLIEIEQTFAEAKDVLAEIINLKGNSAANGKIKEEKSKRTGILRLSGCQLHSVPLDILDMGWLTELYLNDNSISAITNLDNLTLLTTLDLTGNEIHVIQGMQNLSRLQVLELRNNKLKDISGLEQNVNLLELGLSENKIAAVANISHLQKLRKIYLSRNNLSDISQLTDLPLLKRIVLTFNRIRSIKPLLPQMKAGLKISLEFSFDENEEGIFLKDNRPLSEPSIEVLQSGTAAVLKYFGAATTYGTRKLEIVKLILVGNSSVGKTNLKEFLCGETINSEHNSTHILDIKTWYPEFLQSQDGGLMMVNIFDFGGQDYYHDSHRLYYSHDTAYILLWDTSTNKYSEEKENGDYTNDSITYENYPLEYWLESVNYNLTSRGRISFAKHANNKSEPAGNNPPILVLQNKIDISEGPLDQVALCKKYENITSFFNISLKEKKRTDVLMAVLNDYMTELNLAGRQLIEYEYRIVQEFLTRPRDFAVLSLEDFRKECIDIINDTSIRFEKEDAKIIAEILNAIGILFYSNSPDSDGTIFTQITKLNSLIKEVMDEAKRGNDKGMFRKAQLGNLQFRDQILELLVNNNSIIDIGNHTFLLPQFLPSSPDPSVEFFLSAFNFTQVRFVYTAYFHKSLLLSLFAKYVRESVSTFDSAFKANLFWRNGIIIQRGTGATRQIVFVEFCKTETCGMINLKTMTPFNKFGLEKEIENTIDQLNQGWTATKEISANSEVYFDAAELMKRTANGNFEFEKNGSVFRASDFRNITDFPKVPKKLFISYSSKNVEFIKRFMTHLEVLKSLGMIEPWYDRMIEAGSKWDDAIRKEIRSSDVIVFLLSPEFLATEYIMKTEIPLAIEQLQNDSSKFLFVELKPCGWQRTIINKYQQGLDPEAADKTIISIDTPDNDAAWNKVIDVLEAKIR